MEGVVEHTGPLGGRQNTPAEARCGKHNIVGLWTRTGDTLAVNPGVVLLANFPGILKCGIKQTESSGISKLQIVLYDSEPFENALQKISQVANIWLTCLASESESVSRQCPHHRQWCTQRRWRYFEIALKRRARHQRASAMVRAQALAGYITHDPTTVNPYHSGLLA